MTAARRDRRRRDWPRGLYETRPGYFVWRSKKGETLAIGRVTFQSAREQTLAANAHEEESAPTLIERLEARAMPERHTIADLIAAAPLPPKATSQRTYRSLHKAIADELGSKACADLEVKDCADLLAKVREERGEHMAKGVRTRLVALCRLGCEKGWMRTNIAEVTGKVRPAVARARLSLEQFLMIRAKAEPYLQRAMTIALVTGQDRSTVAAMQRTHVRDERLICQRSKTEDKNAPIAIPLTLRLDAIGLTLAEALEERPRTTSRYFVHRACAPVPLDTISADFTAARAAAGIPDTLPDGKDAPTFHEIRSLAKRLYLKQGNVDTKQLLGHSSDTSAELYADPRDQEPVEVKVNAK